MSYIYDDVDAIQNAIDEIINSNDEFTPEVEESLAILMKTKIDTIANGAEWLCKIRANKTSEISGLDTEIKRLQARKKKAEGTITWAENYVFSLLKASGEKKLSAGTFEISTRKSTSVYVAPTFDVAEFMREKVTREPDKIALRDALKNGQTIDGAMLVEKENVSIK